MIYYMNFLNYLGHIDCNVAYKHFKTKPYIFKIFYIINK